MNKYPKASWPNPIKIAYRMFSYLAFFIVFAATVFWNTSFSLAEDVSYGLHLLNSDGTTTTSVGAVSLAEKEAVIRVCYYLNPHELLMAQGSIIQAAGRLKAALTDSQGQPVGSFDLSGNLSRWTGTLSTKGEQTNILLYRDVGDSRPEIINYNIATADYVMTYTGQFSEPANQMDNGIRLYIKPSIVRQYRATTEAMK